MQRSAGEIDPFVRPRHLKALLQECAGNSTCVDSIGAAAERSHAQHSNGTILAYQRLRFGDPALLFPARAQPSTQRTYKNTDSVDYELRRRTANVANALRLLAQQVLKPMPAEFDAVRSREKNIQNPVHSLLEKDDAFPQILCCIRRLRRRWHRRWGLPGCASG
jgi:hypothetical protein